jgi:peptidoglycan/LPS O-acetylase OafA/YrhL
VIALAIAASILLIVFQVFLLIEKNTFFDQLSYASPYFRVFFLVIGMIIAKLVGYLKEKPLKSMTVYEGLICVLCITWFFLRKTCNKIAIITKFVDVLLCVALIFIFALDNGRISAFMNKSKFADLSGYVMYIYLLHYPVIRTLDTFLNLAAFNIGEFTWIIEVLMIVVITIVLSIIIKHILDSIRKKKSLSISTSS